MDLTTSNPSSWQPAPFDPPSGLANPHIQTIASSVGRRLRARLLNTLGLADALLDIEHTAHAELVEINGLHFKVTTNLQADGPLIVIVPGWLGCEKSSYVASCAYALRSAGFQVARITLPDHPGTEQANERMFNSAQDRELIELVRQLEQTHAPDRTGVLGYSLGGNFALRINRALPHIPTLATCPALNPAHTMYQIDSNVIYQRYFVNKWRNVWRAKQAAHPRYDFTEAFQFSTVSALTDYFVKHYCDYHSIDDYFAAYDLTGQALAKGNAHILVAKDDPIIPYSQYAQLPDSITLHTTERGGHGAYIRDWDFTSWADDYACAFFASVL